MENIENLKFYALLFLFAIIVIVFLGRLAFLSEKNHQLMARVKILKSGNFLLDELLTDFCETRFGVDNLQEYNEQKRKIKNVLKESLVGLHNFVRLSTLINDLPGAINSRELKSIFLQLCYSQPNDSWVEFYFFASVHNNQKAKEEIQKVFEYFSRNRKIKIYSEIQRLLEDRSQIILSKPNPDKELVNGVVEDINYLKDSITELSVDYLAPL